MLYANLICSGRESTFICNEVMQMRIKNNNVRQSKIFTKVGLLENPKVLYSLMKMYILFLITEKISINPFV